MDQDAFRNLLDAPSVKAGTGRAAGVLGTHAPKRGYGSSSLKPKDLAPEKDKPAFAPRKVKKDPNAGKYKDRAEMRRLGMEDEFKPAEQLLEEFERRAQDEGEDAELIEEQRKYLGGDAEHSILVKGLDFGLLAAKKAELEAKEGGKYEAELDDLLDGGLGVEMKEDVRPIEIASKKRSRDEIMAELKGKKSKTSAVEAKQPPKDSGLGSKFRKITSSFSPVSEEPKKKKKKKVKTLSDAAPAENAPVAASSSVPFANSIDEALFSKAPVLEVELPIALEVPRPQSPPVSSSIPEPKHESPPSIAEIKPNPEPTAPAAVTAPNATETVDDEDDDIFGGVGDYSFHISDDDDSDSEEDDAEKPRARPETSSTSRKDRDHTQSGLSDSVVRTKQSKSWFSNVEPEETGPSVPVPSGTATRDSLAATDGARPPSPSHRQYNGERARSRSASASPEPIGRLQPLSSSAVPSARDLLAMDEEAEKLENKRSKKAKWRAQQGLPTQTRDDDGEDEDEQRSRNDRQEAGAEKQRLNRETQKLEAFMNKKKQREGP